MGIFELIRIYLVVEKLFQTLDCHMDIAGKNGYKTGIFITKKKFSNLFITLNIVYIQYLTACISAIITHLLKLDPQKL